MQIFSERAKNKFNATFSISKKKVNSEHYHK